MLAILADAVTKMRALPEGKPHSWVFQWYTHLVKGSNFTLEQNKRKEITRIYKGACNVDRAAAEAMWNTCEPHADDQRGDYFLPWHRMYLFFFEQIVRAQSGVERFTLPYWDYYDPAQRSLPAEFRKPDDPVWGALYSAERWPRINQGKPIDEPPSAGPISLTAMQATTYKDGEASGFCSSVQSDPHRQVHFSVGNLRGMMSFPYTANDPLFWLHHCTIDRMWASWNTAGGKNPDDAVFTGQPYTFVEGSGAMVTRKVGEFLNTEALGYVYDSYVPRPEDSLAFQEAAALTFTPHAASARGAGRIRLQPSALRVRLVPESSPLADGLQPGSFPARMQGAGGRGELHLVLEDLSANANPMATFEVYLTGRVRGRYSRSDPSYLGAIEFLETPHHHAGHGRPRKGRKHTFVVGPEHHKLLSDPYVDAPQVIIVPTGPFAARSAPTIGRIVLGSLRKKT
ncbi:MAG TPA: tyrosinase family protein [Pyrinomonadaceae bacterium]|nr:tyrosinase family protein [Pyrinomonadaceae bacterium]